MKIKGELKKNQIGIYKITNLINGKIYIGKSINIQRRFKEHSNVNNHKDTWLYQAMDKYGIDNFEFEVVEECNENDLLDLEKEWILRTSSFPNGYNMTMGGEWGGGYFKLTPQSLEELINDLQNTSIDYYSLSDKYGINLNSLSSVNTGKTYFNSNLNYPLRERVEANKRCIDCGVEITSGSSRCTTCYGKSRRKVERPSKKELIEMVALEGFAAVGRKYGVNGNSVKKWFLNYDLPYHINEIKKMYGNYEEKPIVEPKTTYQEIRMFKENEEYFFENTNEAAEFLLERGKTKAQFKNVQEGVSRVIRGVRKSYLGYGFEGVKK